MQSDSYLIPLIIGGFCLVFPLFWIAIVYLISVMSGWQALASKYATQAEPPSQLKTMAGGMVGLSRYNGTLNVGLSDQGVYLSVIFLFKPGHKPLLIPWSEISEVKQIDYFFQKMYKIKVGQPKVATLTLPVSYFHGWENYFDKYS